MAMIKASVPANVLRCFVEMWSHIGCSVPTHVGVWFPTLGPHSGALRTPFEDIVVLPKLPRGS